MLSIELGENHLSTSTIQLPSAASTNKMLPMLSIELGKTTYSLAQFSSHLQQVRTKMLPMLSIELGENHLSTSTIQLPSAASTNKMLAHAIHWARRKPPIH